MISCARLTIFFLLFFVCGVVWAGGTPDEIQPGPISVQSKEHSGGRADMKYMASGWVLNIFITQKGTRSEGSHGRLLFKGKEVGGKQDETKNLPIGMVQYKGPVHAKANLWDASGWQIINPQVKSVVNSEQPDSGTSRPNIQKLEADSNQFATENN